MPQGRKGLSHSGGAIKPGPCTPNPSQTLLRRVSQLRPLAPRHACRRRAQEAALHDVLLSTRPDDTAAGFRALLLLVVLVAVAAGIAFRQTSFGAAAVSGA